MSLIEHEDRNLKGYAATRDGTPGGELDCLLGTKSLGDVEMR